LLISEATASLVPHFATLEVGEILLKGKSRPSKVFALLGDEEFASSLKFQELARHHRMLLDAVAAGDSGQARAALAVCRTLAPDLQLYSALERSLEAPAPGTPMVVAG
jgi:adenylate cyclase